MEKAAGWKKQWGLFVLLIVQLFFIVEASGATPVRYLSLSLSLSLSPSLPPAAYRNIVVGPGSINSRELKSSLPPLLLHRLGHDYVVMDNGIVKVTLSTPMGMVTRIQYEGIDNILEYWDIIWNTPREHVLDDLQGTSYKVITEDEDQIEISFPSKWDPSHRDIGRPLNVDKRFVMLRGSSGFYTYAIFERLEGFPAMTIDQGRVAFKLHQNLFNYMAISDTRQRVMPTAYDRSTGQTLDYPEAVLLTNPSNPDLKGEVDDKYQYSADNKDNRVHGWISLDNGVGFWVITPSDEFRVGGPLKQELTSHIGPTSLGMFFSDHYAGRALSLEFQDGEPWKKVFGPVFIYLNSDSAHKDPPSLWEDAKKQSVKEIESWPYDFPLSEDFPKAKQRGTVSGRLLICDRYINRNLINANSAYVGLAKPGEVRSWQTENKGYQFWTQADAEGHFVIKGIRPGNYSLFAWVPGIIGDYRYDFFIIITPGGEIRVGDLVYYPPRVGPTLWEIGVPDRTAAEFFVPDPDSKRVTKLSTDHADKFRQYGLWDRYLDLYPNHDLIFTIGTSNYQKNWFFAHVTRKQNNTYVPTTWRISFQLEHVRSGAYTLQLALASTNSCELQVRVNNPRAPYPLFTTRLVGRDNAIARHGIHGLYSLYSVDMSSFHLVKGSNSIYLTQSRGGSPFNGLMYDYLRLEGPPYAS
ncbi:hypothetical protein RHSIM_Rhsim10G0175200 [Rhododendron simsii]|uniref:rhamnogalacturonan endolyase n=1 Tax=Rhododendron simsii TaxID=118357 RepID=A0A834G9I4_RHOSS|nr:hypothetical protein RHSIM_Rhsim10G0175200 [Rhododendron simsii]